MRSSLSVQLALRYSRTVVFVGYGGNQSMKRLITLALLAFGLAAFTPGQDVSKTSQGKDGKRVLLQASPAGLAFGDQVIQTISKSLRVTLTNNTGQPIEISRVNMKG